jgi:hypothetical protein
MSHELAGAICAAIVIGSFLALLGAGPKGGGDG